MLENDCWENADIDNESKTFGEFSEDMKAISENPNYYDKLNEVDKQRILIKDIEIQARFLKNVSSYKVADTIF